MPFEERSLSSNTISAGKHVWSAFRDIFLSIFEKKWSFNPSFEKRFSMAHPAGVWQSVCRSKNPKEVAHESQ